MKFEFMCEFAHIFSIERMAHTLNVSRSGFYRFMKNKLSSREKDNLRLIKEIKTIYTDSRKTYGSPRIHAELISRGEICSRKRVAKLMKREYLQAKMKARFKKTTVTDPRSKMTPNLLGQNFNASKPNQIWVADITYILTQEGWLYIAGILDLFSRRIVGLSMSNRIDTSLVIDALNQALMHRQPSKGLIYHSDKGCQYTSSAFQQCLTKHRLISSMSGKGNCYDNAAMESFFHTLKTEHTHFERYKTREEAKNSIFEYVEIFYNRKRRHSTLGYVSPVDFENKRGKKANSVCL